MEQVVHRTALLHMNHIVEGGDAFELEIARPLDFGHWSAHKLEQMSGFELAHGEAVAIGLTIDLAYGAMMGLVPEPVLRRTRRCLRDMGFTLSHAVLADHETLLEGLEFGNTWAAASPSPWSERPETRSICTRSIWS